MDAIQLNQSRSKMQEAISLTTTLTSGSVDILTDGQTLSDNLAQSTYGASIRIDSIGTNAGVKDN